MNKFMKTLKIDVDKTLPCRTPKPTANGAEMGIIPKNRCKQFI
jgi:hypothetical protein